jgi:hypothetical protein
MVSEQVVFRAQFFKFVSSHRSMDQSFIQLRSKLSDRSEGKLEGASNFKCLQAQHHDFSPKTGVRSFHNFSSKGTNYPCW